MQTPLVMTIIGRDRPGIVESLSDIIAQNGGNWLESRMSHLGGHFAGILRVQVPSDKEQQIIGALKNLEQRGLTIVAHADRDSATDTAKASAVLELMAQDRPGIVRQISSALASKGVNVEELHTEVVSAAMSGETLFKAKVRLFIPPTCKVDDLRATLEKIAQDLVADVTLEPITS